MTGSRTQERQLAWARETAGEVQQDLRSYQEVLRNMSSAPPIRAQVSDSLLFTIAHAILVDSRKTNIPPETYIALLRIENPMLDPTITNWYGAVGLTQVVPRYWSGAFPECGDSLSVVYTQVCYGARIYMHYRARTQTDEQAWWLYNGCTQRRRRAGESCRRYPTWIAEFSANYAEAM